MPIYKSVQYALYCDRCNNLENFICLSRAFAIKTWRKKGWRYRGELWLCPSCAQAKGEQGDASS